MQIVNPDDASKLERKVTATTDAEGIAWWTIKYVASGPGISTQKFSATVINNDGETQGHRVDVTIVD